MRIGTWNELKISRFKDFGAYLTDGTEEVLLPKKQIPSGAAVGDDLVCFVYRDSDDRLIATMEKPLLTAGEIGCLTVKDVTGIGAFLDCGLERDLFLPFKEQTVKVQKGKAYPVRMRLPCGCTGICPQSIISGRAITRKVWYIRFGRTLEHWWPWK